MTTLESSTVSDSAPSGLVEVGLYPSADAGFEHGLVVLATGNGYWLMPDELGHRLLVEPAEAEHIRRQLAKYDRESVGWPPRPVIPPVRNIEGFTPAMWALATIMTFWMEATVPSVFGAGEINRRLILERGEWWRVATALFLHADIGHLVSNLLSGAFVISAVTTSLGKARGWGLIATAAILGNLLSVLTHRGEYHSVGASTAIFGALGILGGNAVGLARESALGQRWRTAALPLASAIVVLTLYGAGAPNVDVVAHVCGFGCGVVLALIAGLKRGRRAKQAVERANGAFTDDSLAR